jgi:hypothetical protein
MRQANATQTTGSSISPRLAAVLASALLLIAAVGLWWRFGEGVFLSGMTAAFIACF